MKANKSKSKKRKRVSSQLLKNLSTQSETLSMTQFQSVAMKTTTQSYAHGAKSPTLRSLIRKEVSTIIKYFKLLVDTIPSEDRK